MTGVLATVCMSGPAPFGAEGLDWFAGMTPSGAAEYRAAATGRSALEACLASAEFDPGVFTPADHAAAFGAWSWLGTVAGQALATGQGGIVDDDLAYVTPWGCDLRQISTPILFAHGAHDRLVPSSHSTWLPHGGTVATPRRRTRLDPQLQRHGAGLAPRARPSPLSLTCSVPGTPGLTG
jgi:pimeloyl-ACP methyl ester carboxylesterase